MTSQNTIKCPSCGTAIDVQDLLSHQLEEEIQHKYQNKYAADQKKLADDEARLAQAREQFEENKKRESELFQERIDRQLKEERRIIEEKVKAKMLEESAEQFDSLQKELNEKSEQVKELNRTKGEIEKLKREKDELKENLEADAQKRINEILHIEKEKIKRVEEERNELRIRELIMQLEAQKELTAEMKRKQDQGSMQLQGEVQELAIEEWLATQFPFDTIEEIKKGARGGDCIQIVNTHMRQNCGKIYYESKRTKDFQTGWIEKFKADIRIKGADIGVLVTDAMPQGFDRLGMKDGIWICTYEEFKGLCTVLRESIIQINLTVSSQENKGDKMHLLYNFLTSNSFRLYVEAIVEGFTAMKTALDGEKRSMQRIWKEREKQIEKVITNTIDMHASIRGIAGDAIQRVKLLELGESEIPEVIDSNAD
jgi:hypothetical protein